MVWLRDWKVRWGGIYIRESPLHRKSVLKDQSPYKTYFIEKVWWVIGKALLRSVDDHMPQKMDTARKDSKNA